MPAAGYAVAAGVSALSSYLASRSAANAATKAGETQADAATTAAQSTADATKYQTDQLIAAASQANNLQELQALLNRQDLQPYRDVGGGALMTLQDLMQPGGYLTESAPTFGFDVNTVSQDPGYQFAFEEGQKALQRSAAAKGTLLSGGTAKALERYGTDYATTKTNDVYNRQLSQYSTNIGTEEMNRGNLYNRLASLAGIGQTATGQGVAAGSGAANMIGSNMTGTAGNVANLGMAGTNTSNNYLTNAAAARASGYMGANNAWQGFANNMSSMPLTLAALLQGGK